MRTTLNEQDIIRIINGASLMASGGGGSVTDGIGLLETYKKNHPGAVISVEMIEPSEMANDVYAVILAGMGAPTKGANKDFTVPAEGSYDEISKMAARDGKAIGYTMPIEMGGFNTFAPMLISLTQQFPVVDADGAGRAVPGLDTVLVHVNGYDTSPLAMAGENNDRVEIIMADPRNAVGAQKIAAPIANGYFEGNAGISGWMLNSEQIADALPQGTITLSRDIGIVIEKAIEDSSGGYVDEIFGLINGMDGLEARALTLVTKISDYTPNENPEFDNGYYYVGDGVTSPKYKIAYENESLVLYLVKGDEEIPYMTAPDIITMYNAKTGEPVTNEDIDQNHQAGTLDDLEVVPGIIRVSDQWWKDAMVTNNAWRPYFEEVGYSGDVIRYPDANA